MAKNSGNPVKQVREERRDVIVDLHKSYYQAAKALSTSKTVYQYQIKNATTNGDPFEGYYWEEIDPVKEPELFAQAFLEKIECRTCGEKKSIAGYGKKKASKTGHNSECKLCSNKRTRSYLECPERKAKKKATSKKWREENKEKIKASKKREIERRKTDPIAKKKYKVSQHKHLHNTKKHKDSYKAYRKRSNHRRRARRLENGYEYFTDKQLKEHWIQEGIDPKKCYYCNEGKYEHQDHYIPLAKGGPDTKANLRPSCADCNLSKSDNDPEEWMACRL